uniref:ATP-dependent DNA helicase n=1 Tax=Tanacetum cinerariifolium TaxID=118510 RepID=A0A6L2KYD5_TANCI|nr:DNA helicase PIF1, ATP-dependent [Tanacetum cinerariifolium]
MYKHFMQNGITRGYITWNYHGEESDYDDDGGGGGGGGGDDDDDGGGDDVPIDGGEGARHLADTEAWKHLDRIDPPFTSDPRNIRSGLATDGFNPFGNLGPKSLLNIDVYLEPLIDELKDLWAGVDAYDALRKEDFTLRATLLRMINDFLAYGMLFGWSVKGYKACPTCMDDNDTFISRLAWLVFAHTIGRKKGGQFTCDMDCTTPADASGLNVDNETTLVQQSGVPLLKRPLRNVRGCLLPCFAAAAASGNRFPSIVELRIQTVVVVDARNTADINCIPISKIFDRFRNMHATSDQSSLAAVDNGNRGSVYTVVVPVSNVPKAASAGLISNNTTKNLKHTCDRLPALGIMQLCVTYSAGKTTFKRQRFCDRDLGNCDQHCRHCVCLFWYNERLKGAAYTRQVEYHLCCRGGQIQMPPLPDPPVFIQQLLTNTYFIEHIRAYNQMFAMTSFRAKVDDLRKKGHNECVLQIPVASVYEGVWARLQEWQAFSTIRGHGILCPRTKSPGLYTYDYLSGLYDAVSRGDHEGITAVSKIILPRTFTGGPRVFEQKVKDFLSFLKEVKPFSDVSKGNRPHIDVIQNYVDDYFICPYEACWRIFDVPIHIREPTVQLLNVHLENMQRFDFCKSDTLHIIVNLPEKKKMKLTEWFVYNNENVDGRYLTYLDFPSEFVCASTTNRQELLFIYGHGGTGKTFLWRTIISSFRSHGKIVLVVASSGIASLLLPVGRTSHSRFKLPLELTDESLCHAKKKKQFAKWLLDVGNDEIGETDAKNEQDSSWVTIPPEYTITADEAGMSELIDFIYDDTTLKASTAGSLQKKVIVQFRTMSAATIASLRIGHENCILEAKVYRRWISKSVPEMKALKYWKESEFPCHNFELISYHQPPSRVPYKDENSKLIYPILIDYLGRVRSISDIIPFGTPTTSEKYLRKVDIEDLE